MIIRVAVRARGRIYERVLVARLFRDARVQLFHVPALQSVVDVAARILGIFREALKPAVENSSSHADAINGYFVPQQILDDRVVLVAVQFSIVQAVGDEQDHLAPLALWVAVFQQLRRGVDGVVLRLGGLRLDNQGGFRRFRGFAGNGV